MEDDRLNILLVEDNEDDYLIVRDLLRDIDPERFALEWADSCAEGLRSIQARRHDLILLDFRLSDGTGLGLLQETQALSGRAPVVLMTGQGDHDVDVQAMRAGAADYVVKDRLSADLLERMIRYAVERQKSAEALRVSEDRYRTFVENSTEGIWRFELEQPMPTDLPEDEQIAHLDRYAYVAECNDAMARIYGYDHAADILGARFGEFLWSREVSDDNYPRRLIRNRYRLVSVEAFEYDRHGQAKCVLHNLIGVVENGLLYRIWSSQSDITERTRSENAQAQLAAIVETSDDAIFSKTLDGLIVTWNKSAEALYGYTAEEITGQSVSRLTPAHRQQEMKLVHKRVERGERVPQFETVRRRKDGHLIDVSLAVSPIIDAVGRVTGSSSIARDISERKIAERRLRESEANMAAAQRIAHFGSWEMDLDSRDDMSTNPHRWSDETYRIFGYDPGGMSATRELFYRGVPPEEHPIVHQAVAAAVAQRQLVTFVHRVRQPGGEERVVRQTVQYFAGEEAGRPARLVGTVHDITEQRRTEDALRQQNTLIRIAGKVTRTGGWALEIPEQRVFWSDEVFDILENPRGVIPTIAETLALYPVPWRDSITAAIGECAENGTPFDLEVKVLTRQSRELWVRVCAEAEREADGTVKRVQGAFQDITERKRAEGLLTESRQRLALATESAKIGIWDWDITADRMVWDAQMYTLYGIREQDFVGAYRAWQNGLHPEDRDRAEAEIALALDGSRDFHTQFRVVWPGGEVRHIEAHGTVLRADDGSAQRMIGVNWDITEREWVEKSLRQSEKRFQSVVEKVESLVIHDVQGRLIDVNQNACDSLGYTRGELLRLRVPDYELKYEQANVARLWERMASGEINTIVVDGLHRRKDGSAFPVEVRVGLMETEGPPLMVAVARNVTERRQAQDALRDSEQEQRQLAARLEAERARLAEAQALAKVGSWELECHTGALTWSDENYRIFGMDRASFGGTYTAFLDRVHPDDRASVDRSYRASVAGRVFCEMDHRVQMDDGSLKYVHERCQTFYDVAGEPAKSIGTTQDITENHLVVEALRQSEHGFRRIVETTHEGVVQVDADARITYVNRRFGDMLGYTSGELIGRPIFEMLVEDSRTQARHSFEERRDGTAEQLERCYRHKNGSLVWGLVSVSPILDDAGLVIGSLEMLADITERKRLETQVRQSEKLAALGALVAGVVHEINNPLAAILGNAELLEMHADPQVRQDAQTIQRMSQRVTRIVRSLLTFARPQKEERRPEALNTLVEHTLEMTTHKLRTAGVSLLLHLQDPSPVASASANEVQQILLNLVMNAEHALRATQGEKRLVISTGVERIDGSDWVTVSVADNGCGIPEETKARIFDPFFTTKDVGEGTGLGLSICHGIAEAHGGRLSVESSVGRGTTFTLALPSATPAPRSGDGSPVSPSPDSSQSDEER